jgi:hypothetical protein
MDRNGCTKTSGIRNSTKTIEGNGVLDHRLRGGVPETLRVPDHLRRLVETALCLAENPAHENLHLRAWAHTAGYRGHFLTKSGRFSTTFGALRSARQEWRVAQSQSTDRIEAVESSSEQAGALIREWQLEGVGYTTAGDAWLAESMEYEERLAKRFKYESRRDPFQDSA